jgi:Sodium/calcium exchanger protein
MIREGRGAIVFNDYKTCSASQILLPGFQLLPEWLLAGTDGLLVAQYTKMWPNLRHKCHFVTRIRADGFVSNAVVYGTALAWCFFGVALISDIFMQSIEQITSAEKVITRVGRDGKRRIVTVSVWNATVANLTLMALGSSAPEIMLATIETILTLGSIPGELGPSTIVGECVECLILHAHSRMLLRNQGLVRGSAAACDL